MEDKPELATPVTLDLTSFPLEVLRLIGSHLDRRSLASVSSASREHRHLLRSDVFEEVSFFHSKTPLLAKLQYFLDDDSDPSLTQLRSYVKRATILANYVPVTRDSPKWTAASDPKMDWLFDDSIPGPGLTLPRQLLETIQSMENLQVLAIDAPDAFHAVGLSYEYLDVFKNCPPLTISTLIIKGEKYNNHAGAILRACSPDHLKSLQMKCNIHPYGRAWAIIPDFYYTAVRYHGPTLKRLCMDWHFGAQTLGHRFLSVVADVMELVSQDFPELQRLVLPHNDCYKTSYAGYDADEQSLFPPLESDIERLGISLGEMEELTHFGFTCYFRHGADNSPAESPESMIEQLGRLAPQLQHISVSPSFSTCCDGIRTGENTFRMIPHEPNDFDWECNEGLPNPHLTRIFHEGQGRDYETGQTSEQRLKMAKEEFGDSSRPWR